MPQLRHLAAEPAEQSRALVQPRLGLLAAAALPCVVRPESRGPEPGLGGAEIPVRGPVLPVAAAREVVPDQAGDGEEYEDADGVQGKDAGRERDDRAGGSSRRSGNGEPPGGAPLRPAAA